MCMGSSTTDHHSGIFLTKEKIIKLLLPNRGLEGRDHSEMQMSAEVPICWVPVGSV